MNYKVITKPHPKFPFQEGATFQWNNPVIVSGGEGITKQLWDIQDLLVGGWIQVVKPTQNEGIQGKTLLLG